MKATELRIGNLAFRNGEIHRIASVESISDNIAMCAVIVNPTNQVVSRSRTTGFTPIPLTEEWLKRLGFEYSDLNGDSGLWKIPPFQIYGKYNQFIYDYKLDVNYVHQLQNLYFALTGEELNQTKEDE
tara:strand:+ start:319 stop:702 length:384 start_codon:yes stop_codon:yes gene_type:complete